MSPFILLFLFVSQICCIYFFNYFAIKINLLDFPDKRKTHSGNIPLIGGLSIYIPVLLCLILLDVPIEILIIYLTSFILLFVDIFNFIILIKNLHLFNTILVVRIPDSIWVKN